MAIVNDEEIKKEEQEVEQERKQIMSQRLVEEALHEFNINPKFADILHYIIRTKENQVESAVTEFKHELDILRNQTFKLREEIFDEIDELVDKYFGRCY